MREPHDWAGNGARSLQLGGCATLREYQNQPGGSMQATVAENCYRVSSGENTTSGRGNGAGKPQWVAE